jgi:hypothetical protein
MHLALMFTVYILSLVTAEDGLFYVSSQCGASPKGLVEVMYRSGNKIFGVVDVPGAKSWNQARATCQTMFSKYPAITNSDIATYKNIEVQHFFENFPNLSSSDMLYVGLYSTKDGTDFQWASNDTTISASSITSSFSPSLAICVNMKKLNNVANYSVSDCGKNKQSVMVACELESTQPNSSEIFSSSQCSNSKKPSTTSDSGTKYEQPTVTQLHSSLVVNSVGVAVFVPSSIFGMFLLMLSDTMNLGLSFLKRKRILIIAEISSFTLSVICFSMPYLTQTEMNIQQTVLGFFFFGFFGLSIVFFRMADLYIALVVSQYFHSVNVNSQLTLSAPERQSWWIKNRRFFGTKQALLISFLYAVFSTGFVHMIFSLMPLDTAVRTWSDLLRAYYLRGAYAALFHYVTCGMACVYLGYKIKFAGEETIGVKRELSLKLVGAFIAAISLSMGGYTPFFEEVETKMILIWIGVGWEIVITCWTIMQRLRKNRSRPRIHVVETEDNHVLTFDETDEFKLIQDIESLKPSGTDACSGPTAVDIVAVALPVSENPSKLTLSSILTDPLFCELFKDFLCKELTAEHLFFIQAHEAYVKKWKQIDTKHRTVPLWNEYVEDTNRIFFEFVDNGAMAPINVSYNNREVVKRKVETFNHLGERGNFEIDVLLFSKCHKEVYMLLKLDTLSRFKETLECKEYLKRINGNTASQESVLR